jgi:hypothetical protein
LWALHSWKIQQTVKPWCMKWRLYGKNGVKGTTDSQTIVLSFSRKTVSLAESCQRIEHCRVHGRGGDEDLRDKEMISDCPLFHASL